MTSAGRIPISPWSSRLRQQHEVSQADAAAFRSSSRLAFLQFDASRVASSDWYRATAGRQASPRASTAQTIRAVLLAMATVRAHAGELSLRHLPIFLAGSRRRDRS